MTPPSVKCLTVEGPPSETLGQWRPWAKALTKHHSNRTLFSLYCVLQRGFSLFVSMGRICTTIQEKFHNIGPALKGRPVQRRPSWTRIPAMQRVPPVIHHKTHRRIIRLRQMLGERIVDSTLVLLCEMTQRGRLIDFSSSKSSTLAQPLLWMPSNRRLRGNRSQTRVCHDAGLVHPHSVRTNLFLHRAQVLRLAVHLLQLFLELLLQIQCLLVE
mmetsp:Transcript_12519/g.34599  ORF Transcript_12519/g.34599 Transcript_12519/m.34599 type:complete len:214 (+) Transcript_12519:240-881(+)